MLARAVMLPLVVCLVAWPQGALSQQDLAGPTRALFDACDRPGTPGGFAAAVLKDGRVLFKGAYGFANSEHEVPFTTRTVTDVASVAKQFTGFAVATLVQQGRLALDDDVRRYLPEVPDFGDRITIRHLLYHSSGIRDWVGLVKLSGRYDEDVITDEFLMRLVMNQRELNFRPGERFQYSNTGYFLLARMVSAVTGQPFAAWMRENVFRPLGMNDTRVASDYRAIVPHRASPYRKGGNGDLGNGTSNLEAYGSSVLLSTLEDMVKWVANLETRGVGAPGVWDMMLQRGALNNGERVGYGFGLSIGDTRGVTTVGHGGSWAGYLSQVTYYPDLHLAYVLMANRDPSGVYVDDDLFRLFVPDTSSGLGGQRTTPIQRTQVEIDPDLLAEYAGTYEFFDKTATIEPAGDHLLVRLPWESVAFYPESQNEFFRRDFDARMAFLRNDAGGVDRLVYYFRGSPNRPFRRLRWEASGYPGVEELLGEYESPELRTRYEVRISGNRLILWHLQNEEVELLRLDRDHYLGKTWWCEAIEMERDENDRITGFALTADQGNIQHLRFVRR